MIATARDVAAELNTIPCLVRSLVPHRSRRLVLEAAPCKCSPANSHGPHQWPKPGSGEGQVSELRCTRCGPAARRWCSRCPVALRRRCTGCRPVARHGSCSPESSLRRCRIPLMPAIATVWRRRGSSRRDSASPPTTYPSIIMTTAASSATGTAATSSSASSVTAIMALADLSGVRSAYQPVIMLTSPGPELLKGPGLPNNTICRVPCVNAPPGQDHPVTVRHADRGRAACRRSIPSAAGPDPDGPYHRHVMAAAPMVAVLPYWVMAAGMNAVSAASPARDGSVSPFARGRPAAPVRTGVARTGGVLAQPGAGCAADSPGGVTGSSAEGTPSPGRKVCPPPWATGGRAG